MWAVVEIAKKQYLVAKDDQIEVQLLKDVKDKMVFDQVLLAVDEDKVQVGTPYLKKATVSAELVKSEVKGPKVISYKYRRRKKSRWKKGHRQKYTILKITGINC